MTLTENELRDLQRGLNAFTSRYLYGVAQLVVDGKRGRHTDDHIRMVKFYLGYEGIINAAANKDFRQRLWHPKNVRYSSPTRLARAALRRIKQRRDAKAEETRTHKTHGVGTYDGRAVANAAIPILEWCRRNGWHGYLVSGYRTPAYSETLCYRMCGRPQCPGTCAGRATNHAYAEPGRFACDVSMYDQFREIVAKCPLQPKLVNHLPRDLVHFSPSGN